MKKLIILIIVAMPHFLYATHIIGGEMTYEYLGDNNYSINLTLYRDCYSGEVPFDNPAAIGVFDSSGNLLQELLLTLIEEDTLEANLLDCQGIGLMQCTEQGTYSVIVNLPFIPGGYIISYQRCCRNYALSNITNPLAIGATYWIYISEETLLLGNSSPKFSIVPPFHLCVGIPFSIDHSAEDMDNDSIVYRLCVPYAGADQDFPMPQPPNPPPYIEINWASPYSLDNLMGGQPLSIDPNTGELTGTANTIGYFLVAICIEEYRNGELISLTRRDFQISVEACTIVADFENEIPICGDLEIDFTNNSLGSSTYLWDFNDPMNPDSISTVENPTFNFSGYGQYIVDLVINPGSECSDTISKTIELTPPSTFTADYNYDISGCDNIIELNLIDNSSVNMGEISQQEWIVSSEDISMQGTGQQTQFVLPHPGDWSIELLLTSSDGCTFSLIDTIWACTNNTYTPDNQDYTVCPNPVETIVNIHLANPVISVYQVDIFDIENRKVLNKSVSAFEGDFLLDLHDLLPGSYFLRVVSNQIYHYFLLIKT